MTCWTRSGACCHEPCVSVRLAISDLQVRFGDRPVVQIDEFTLGEAEIAGLAGESGSGKSMTTLAILGLAHTVGATVSGSIRLDGTELTRRSQRELRELRGRQIAAIFQSPAMAFSPVFKVGQVVLGALRLHGMSKAEAAEAAAQAMRQVLLAARPAGPLSRRSCPAGNCSGSRSRSRWPCGPRCCWPTSRPARWT